MIKPTNFHVNNNKVIKFATNMTKKGVYLPIILLESTVVAGRTYQAYKRGGATEARERVLEETTGSLVWLGGAPLLCKVGNWIGKQFANIKNTNFDIGKDTLRNPLKNVIKSIPNANIGHYAAFKLTNSLASVLIAGSFLGFVVPKINQRLTRFLNNKNKKNDLTIQQTQEKTVQNAEQTNAQQLAPQIVVPQLASNKNAQFKDMDKFLSANKNNSKSVSFKGAGSADVIATIAHNLETNAAYQLLTTDTLVSTGRGYNARNADECREILFRDITSSFFYLFASPLVIKGLTKLDNKALKGNTSIDPHSAMKIHNYLLDNMPKEKMTQDEFSKFALGNFNESEFKKLKFDSNGLISLKDFKATITDAKLQDKALKMSQLQPLQNGVSVLTQNQAKNVLTDGAITEPKFLKGVLNSIYGSLDGKEDVLTSPTKYIARNDIESSVENIKSYAGSIVEYAKKHNIADITPETMLKVNKRNLNHRIGFLVAGFVTAAAFLSTIIPKVQYYITKVKTGSDKFPGVKNLDV